MVNHILAHPDLTAAQKAQIIAAELQKSLAYGWLYIADECVQALDTLVRAEIEGQLEASLSPSRNAAPGDPFAD